MSDLEQQQEKASRSTKTKRFWIGVRFVTLLGMSGVNIFFLLVIVPKFEQIFADALPSQPLASVTEFFITARMALVIIDLGWPILGTVLLRRQKPSAILWIKLGILWNFLQFGVTVYALIMPIVCDHGGMGPGK